MLYLHTQHLLVLGEELPLGSAWTFNRSQSIDHRSQPVELLQLSKGLQWITTDYSISNSFERLEFAITKGRP